MSLALVQAAGASPAMVHSGEEVDEFMQIASALSVNIGTLSPAWVEGMRKAIGAAKAAGKPWVLDPVGVGATSYRTKVGDPPRGADLLRLETQQRPVAKPRLSSCMLRTHSVVAVPLCVPVVERGRRCMLLPLLLTWQPPSCPDLSGAD
jgi:hypothetical protein